MDDTIPDLPDDFCHIGSCKIDADSHPGLEVGGIGCIAGESVAGRADG